MEEEPKAPQTSPETPEAAAAPEPETTPAPTEEAAPSPTPTEAPEATAEPEPAAPAETQPPAADTAATPVEQPVETPPVVSDRPTGPGRKSGLKWLIALIVLIVIVGGGYVAWSQLHNSTPKTTSVIKSIPLARFGSVDGPIGPDYVFPHAQALSLSKNIDLQIFEGLTGYQGQKLVPLLATSWTNPNKNTWVFQLAHNVKFQNGDTMTAADVVRSLQADIANSDWSTYTSTLSNVAATGPNEVTVTTSQPDALLLDRLAYCFIFKPGTGTTNYGTGPYTIDTTKPFTDNSTTLKAFPGYHGGVPKTQVITYEVYKDSAALVNAYKAGKIDSYEVQTTSLHAGKGVSSLTVQEPGSYGLFLNMVRPNGIMANKQIRQAVAYAINRPDWVKQLGNDTLPANQIIPKTVVGYDASATFPGLNVAKSKQLQAAAGYPDGAPVTVLYIKGLQPDAPILVQQLRAAGFKVTEDAVASPDDAVAQTQAGTYDILGVTEYSDFNDGIDVFTSLLDSKSSSFYVYDNPQYDAMIDAAEQTFDPAAYVQKLQTINKFIASNFLWIPVRTSVDVVYSKASYQIPAHYSLAASTIFFWQVGQKVTTTSTQGY